VEPRKATRYTFPPGCASATSGIRRVTRTHRTSTAARAFMGHLPVQGE
jgi:hypothetical protein